MNERPSGPVHVVGAGPGVGAAVAHLVVQGAVGVGRQHDPDTVAELLWRLQAESTETFAVLR